MQGYKLQRNKSNASNTTDLPDTAYVGKYGNFLFGNVSVFINSTTKYLMLQYGPVQQWRLERLENGEELFTMFPLEPMWYRFYGALFSVEQGRVTQVEIPFNIEWTQPFVRDRTYEGAPPPVEPC